MGDHGGMEKRRGARMLMSPMEEMRAVWAGSKKGESARTLPSH